MHVPILPPIDEMREAFLRRDAAYDGVFYTGVLTTGIFCRPSCPAKKPLPENLEFFASVRDAVASGYRPCARCRPMEASASVPPWLEAVRRKIDDDPARRWTDGDLRKEGLQPDRVRRWFKRVYGMTFLAYGRSKRIASALDSIRAGARVTASAFEYGFESTSGFSDAVRRDTGRPPRHADVDRVVTVTRFSTPLGVMFAAATDDMVCLLEFADRPMLETQLQRMRARIGCRYLPGTNVVLQRLEKELSAYFDGELSTFTIPLLKTGTPFQMKVWDRLCEIPFGSTTSYAVLAKDIGRPSAVRAVAKANGDNRIAILIPCHRVIGSDGRLTGYGGGLWRKHRLLEIETGFRDDHALPENAPSLVQHHPMGNRGTVHAEDAVVDTGR